MDRPVLSAISRPLAPGVLISELYGKHHGQPILVIGGGPSAPEQYEWARLRVKHGIIISANGHAWSLGLRPDYIFCKDHVHSEKQVLMEGLLRSYVVPIATPHYWGDYRATDWPIQGNSGMMAIALAALMMGGPIIPIGFDCFQGATYFHAPNITNVSLGRPHGYWKSRMDRLKGRLEGAVIRSIGGITADTFKPYSKHEALPEPQMPKVFSHYKNQKTFYVRTIKPFYTPYDKGVQVPTDYVLPVCANEAMRYPNNGVAVAIGPQPDPNDRLLHRPLTVFPSPNC